MFTHILGDTGDEMETASQQPLANNLSSASSAGSASQDDYYLPWADAKRKIPYFIRDQGLDKVPLRFYQPTCLNVSDSIGGQLALVREALLKRYPLTSLTLEQRCRPDVILFWLASQGGKGSLHQSFSELTATTQLVMQETLTDDNYFGLATPRMCTARPPRSSEELVVSPDYNEFITHKEATRRVMTQRQCIESGKEPPYLYLKYYAYNWYGLSVDEIRKAADSPNPLFFASCDITQLLDLKVVFPGAHICCGIPQYWVDELDEENEPPELRDQQSLNDYYFRFYYATEALVRIGQSLMSSDTANGFGCEYCGLVDSVRYIPNLRRRPTQIRQEMMHVALDLVEVFRAMDGRPNARYLREQQFETYRDRLHLYQKFVRSHRDDIAELARQESFSDPFLEYHAWLRKSDLSVNPWNYRSISPLGDIRSP